MAPVGVFVPLRALALVFNFSEYKFKVCKKTIDPDQKLHSAVFDLDLIYYMYLKLTSTKFWESKGQLLQFCLEEKQNVCLKIFWQRFIDFWNIWKWFS